MKKKRPTQYCEAHGRRFSEYKEGRKACLVCLKKLTLQLRYMFSKKDS